MCFAVFTASSACSLHCGYSTKYNLWLIPHAFRKFWKSDDLHCWSLSLAISSGTPYNLNSDCKWVSNEALVVLRCSSYHYCTTSFNKAWTQVLHRFKSCLLHVRDLWWWGSLTMVPARNERLNAFCWSIIPQKQFIIIMWWCLIDNRCLISSWIGQQQSSRRIFCVRNNECGVIARAGVKISGFADWLDATWLQATHWAQRLQTQAS